MILCGVVSLSHAQEQVSPTAPAKVGLVKPLNETESAADTGKTLADRFNLVIKNTNDVLSGILFYDISFGVFKKEAEVREPAYQVAKTSFEATRYGVDGLPLGPQGNPLQVQIAEGQLYQPLDQFDKPMTRVVMEDGVAKIEKQGASIPLLVFFLVVGLAWFTFSQRFINLRGFRHAIDIVRGKFSDNRDSGEVTPFQALCSALSATVGLGNIAGVAAAMAFGGPGALFWMIVLGFFGMSAKFQESTLAQMYRVRNKDGTVSGGAMYYLEKGLTQMGLRSLGQVLAIVFSVCCILASLGAGNMFQANQAFSAFHGQITSHAGEIGNPIAFKLYASIGFGLMLSVVTGVVVIGGIRRIGQLTEKLVPFMAVLYVGACLIIIGAHFDVLGSVISDVFQGALGLDATAGKSVLGGIVGAMMIGFQRAAFSSESGIGSSAIAHSAAKQSFPVREGFVASLEPFIDTVIICAITGLTVLVTRAYMNPTLEGSQITARAFEHIPFMPNMFQAILSISIVLFAFSTLISWCYYGERAWGYLVGLRSVVIFRLIFIGCVFVGSVASLGPILVFADIALLSMALPNIIGCVLLTGVVRRALKVYWEQKKTGEFIETHKHDDETDCV